MFPYSEDHILIKKDRAKLALASILGRTQKRLDAKGGVIARVKFDLINPKQEIYKTIEQKSNSFVRNYYNVSALNALMSYTSSLTGGYGAGYLCTKSTAGTTASSYAGGIWVASNGAVNDATTGIVLGTGNTAESIEDYVLVTPILEGTTSGKMTHYAQSWTFSWDSGTSKWTTAISRAIMNSSGGTITVKEVGLISVCRPSAAETLVLAIRDVPAEMAIVNGGGIVVTYNLTYQF